MQNNDGDDDDINYENSRAATITENLLVPDSVLNTPCVLSC